MIDEANAAREAGEARVILFGLCGHGNFDLSAYDAYLGGELEDPEFSETDFRARSRACPRRRRSRSESVLLGVRPRQLRRRAAQPCLDHELV